MPRNRLIQPLFYVDADVLGLARLLIQVRGDVTYPGFDGAKWRSKRRPSCEIKPSAPDQEWIRIAAARGWLIITRDSQIQAHESLRASVCDSGARMVALAGRDSLDSWAQLRLVVRHWEKIEEAQQQPGPFIYSLTKTTFRPVEL